jgi:hypothetical protein
MTEVPATEFARNFGRYREAAQRGPVAVQAHGRITGYFVSAHDFEEFKRVRAMMPVALGVEELDAKTITGLKAAKMDSRHAALDRLMD